jgi:hypothetical protein
MLAQSDLCIIYGKINAYGIVLKHLVKAIANLTTNPAETLEYLRSSAMDDCDRKQRRPDDPNPDFTEESMLQGLGAITEIFSQLESKPTADAG